MNSLLARLTPGSLVRAARLTAVVLIVALMVGYAENAVTVETVGMGGFGLAVLLLLAFPDQRAQQLVQQPHAKETMLLGTRCKY